MTRDTTVPTTVSDVRKIDAFLSAYREEHPDADLPAFIHPNQLRAFFRQLYEISKAYQAVISPIPLPPLVAVDASVTQPSVHPEGYWVVPPHVQKITDQAQIEANQRFAKASLKERKEYAQDSPMHQAYLNVIASLPWPEGLPIPKILQSDHRDRSLGSHGFDEHKNPYLILDPQIFEQARAGVIAHELGHYLKEHVSVASLMQRHNESVSPLEDLRRAEKEADVFAAEACLGDSLMRGLQQELEMGKNKILASNEVIVVKGALMALQFLDESGKKFYTQAELNGLNRMDPSDPHYLLNMKKMLERVPDALWARLFDEPTHPMILDRVEAINRISEGMRERGVCPAPVRSENPPRGFVPDASPARDMSDEVDRASSR